MKQLPDKLKIAIARYYMGHDTAAKPSLIDAIQKLTFHIVGSVTIPARTAVPTFDKDKAREHISEVAAKCGFTYSQAGGTMWFHRALPSGNTLRFMVNEDDYLDSGQRFIQKRTKLADAL